MAVLLSIAGKRLYFSTLEGIFTNLGQPDQMIRMRQMHCAGIGNKKEMGGRMLQTGRMYGRTDPPCTI